MTRSTVSTAVERNEALARMIANAEAQADDTRADAGPAIILNMAGLMLTAHSLAEKRSTENLRMIDRISKILGGKAEELGAWARTQIMMESDNAPTA